MQERIRSAFNATGYLFPCGRLMITLTPASPTEGGAAFALALAVGILQASQQITARADLTRCLFLGGLSRDGQCQHTPGILPMMARAREHCLSSVFVPAEDVVEASLIQGVTIYPVETLAQAVVHLNGVRQIEPYTPQSFFLDAADAYATGLDISAIRGQEHVKRALVKEGCRCALSMCPLDAS